MWRFNKNLIPICSIIFLLNTGHYFTANYLVLLMRSLGLTLTDASIINGCLPWFAFFTSPIIGYIADKFGTKMVLISAFTGLMITSTALNFLPAYRSYKPKVALDKNIFNESEATLDTAAIVWLGTYGCEDDPSEFFIKKISCDKEVIEFLNITLPDQPKHQVGMNCTNQEMNACRYVYRGYEEKDTITCDANFYMKKIYRH